MCIHIRPMIVGMEKPKTRVTGTGASTVPFQTRVAPDAKAAIEAAARRSGVSVAYYTEKLIQQLEESNALPVIHPPRLQQEELPIPVA